MDLKEDRKERQEQIDATLGDSKLTSQEGVDLYDKWSEHYEQVTECQQGQGVCRPHPTPRNYVQRSNVIRLKLQIAWGHLLRVRVFNTHVIKYLICERTTARNLKLALTFMYFQDTIVHIICACVYILYFNIGPTILGLQIR